MKSYIFYYKYPEKHITEELHRFGLVTDYGIIEALEEFERKEAVSMELIVQIQIKNERT
jgi:hypothetical protein